MEQEKTALVEWVDIADDKNEVDNKIPAIVDNSPIDGGEPISIFESGAILIPVPPVISIFITILLICLLDKE
mgnify:CR=1 FL=1